MAMAVPEQRLLPSSTMSSTNWQTASLVPIDFTVGIQERLPAKQASDVILQDTASSATHAHGSICFVVRRPG